MPWFIAASRTRRENDNLTSDTPSETYFSAYGGPPPLWAVQKMTLLVLLAVVLGPLTLTGLITAGPIVHRQLANAPRKRKPHLRYPIRTLF